MIEHGGNLAKLAQEAGCDPAELLDFSSNLHPAGIPEGLFETCFRALEAVSPYPEVHAESLSRLAAARWNLKPENILFGNGSSELLSLIPRLGGCARMLSVTPGYLEYEHAFRQTGIPVERFSLREEDDFRLDLKQLKPHPGDMVVLGNPGNPAGNVLSAKELYSFVTARPEVSFLVDEAFADFSGETLLDFPLPRNLIILRSMTKFYSIAGLRLGYAVAQKETIAALRELQPCWAVGTVAAHAAGFLLKRKEQADKLTPQLREALAAGLRKAGLKVFPSAANYLLVKSARPLFRELLKKKIAVRDCSNYPGLSEHFFRVAVRSEEDNAKLLAVLGEKASVKRRTPALMLQGTCSNAGKSVLTAGFCRILLEDGFRVAPFKAQNMALNSYVTPDGGEIGRAQAVQAEACRLDPDVRMNPILLKPNSDLGSQVIVKGHAIGNMKVREYYRNKPVLWETVKACYDSLSSEYDAIVLEGAGSPGEVNLKKNDIVNMNMAAYAGAKVLLTGDIDRGGVYASFVGTYATLSFAERKLLYGFLVNKFRGDPTLLADAHTYVENMTGKPVMGVIDYVHDLGLPEEDSVNFSFIRPAPKFDVTLDMAIIQLGHIANFTDFVPFELEPDVTVRKVRKLGELGTPDIVVLPGSKGVADDMAQLDRNLFRELLERGVHFIGICGGLQLLGRELLDPDKVESPEKAVRCLGFLDLSTVMEHEKVVRRTRARRGETELAGYELHHGRTSSADPELLTHTGDDGEIKGYEKDRIFTSYLHGVFDDDAFRRRYLNEVRSRLGMPPLEGVTTEYETERALNRLAAHIRSRVDMNAIYRNMGL